MIGKDLARKFIEQVTQYTEFNVNIMDADGTIIASRDPEEIHSVALIVKMAIETMLRYERSEQELRLRRGRKEKVK